LPSPNNQLSRNRTPDFSLVGLHALLAWRTELLRGHSTQEVVRAGARAYGISTKAALVKKQKGLTADREVNPASIAVKVAIIELQ
jgi:hypothetical protein